METFSTQVGSKKISFELTGWAEQANGSVLVRLEDTLILVTCVMAKQESQNQGFFPLTVDYEEKFYAAGKILGSRFVRREGRPSDEAVITARLIDRAIRPLFPKGFKREVQVIATCLSWDTQNDPDTAGLLGASLALSLSDIPWNGPLAVVRIGRKNGEFIVNPTYEERTQGDLDFVVAGVKEDNHILLNMIEAESNEVSEEVYEKALEFATPLLLNLIEFQTEIISRHQKEKAVVPAPAGLEELQAAIKEWLGDRLNQALFHGEKQTRMEAVDSLKKELTDFVNTTYKDPSKAKLIEDLFDEEIDGAVHKAAIEKAQRVDGRALDEIRSLNAHAGLLPRTHGSGMFERGQTRTLSILTLGAPGDQKLMEGMEFIGKKRFMHHYNFPPYAPGEVKPLRGPGRREIGHGILAEKALLPVIPTTDEFPYTIRIVTEVLSSNGSTSMASVCSASLALMDAGVPIKRPAAGISMGLMQDDQGNYKILTDIQGPEDHHGDMDFKVAGTKEGISAIQLDVKVKGIGEQIFHEALSGAKKTRHHILDEVISPVLAAPRSTISPWAPRILSLQINPEKIGLLIGPGGKTINKIIAECGVEIDIEDTGQVFITGTTDEQIQKATAYVKNLTREILIGQIYQGKVRRILDFGAFVDLGGGQEGLVHISQLADHRVQKVQDILHMGDVIRVKVIEIDDQGRINLSLKEALKESPEQ